MGGVFSKKSPKKSTPIAPVVEPKNISENFKMLSYSPPFSKQSRINNKHKRCRYPGCTHKAKTRVARTHHESSHPLPSGVKVITHSTVSKTRFDLAKKLIQTINRLPVYLISAHACICKKGATCFGERHPFTFEVPRNTFIVSIAQPGETVLGCVDPTINYHVNDIKQFLYLHSTSDIKVSSDIGKTQYQFFSGLQRASHPSAYPNVLYTFNEFNEDGTILKRNRNPYGVYEITDLMQYSRTNITSIIPQDILRENWTLHDIINEVYAKTHRRNGIFISSGCLVGCFTDEPLASLKEAGEIAHIADNEYNTNNETLTAKELLSIGGTLPVNSGVMEPFTRLNPKVLEQMVKSGLYSPT